MQVHDTSYKETDAEDEKDENRGAPEMIDGRDQDVGVSLDAFRDRNKEEQDLLYVLGDDEKVDEAKQGS